MAPEILLSGLLTAMSACSNKPGLKSKPPWGYSHALNCIHWKMLGQIKVSCLEENHSRIGETPWDYPSLRVTFVDFKCSARQVWASSNSDVFWSQQPSYTLGSHLPLPKAALNTSSKSNPNSKCVCVLSALPSPSQVHFLASPALKILKNHSSLKRQGHSSNVAWWIYKMRKAQSPPDK